MDKAPMELEDQKEPILRELTAVEARQMESLSSVDQIQGNICWEYPKYFKYCREFYSECPDKGMWVKAASKGHLWVIVNGKLIVSGYFSGHWIFVKGEHLNCGCNTICFISKGYCPWVWHQLWLPEQNCHQDCKNIPNTFYNRR